MHTVASAKNKQTNKQKKERKKHTNKTKTKTGGNNQPPLLRRGTVPLLQSSMAPGCQNYSQLNQTNKTSAVSWIWDGGYKINGLTPLCVDSASAGSLINEGTLGRTFYQWVTHTTVHAVEYYSTYRCTNIKIISICGHNTAHLVSIKKNTLRPELSGSIQYNNALL